MEANDIWPAVLSRLREYVAQNWDVDGVCKAIGVQPQTVGEWLAQVRPANGERLIRLWHFLAAAGFESPELEALPEYNRYAGQLLAMSIVTMDELMEFINVKNNQTALQFLRGTPPMHPVMRLPDLKKEYDEALKAKLSRLPKFSREGPSSPPLLTRQGPAPPKAPLTALQPLPGAADYALDAAIMLGSALPLCRYLNEECSPEDRSRFRKLMGAEALFELSNTTGALCSERARKSSR